MENFRSYLSDTIMLAKSGQLGNVDQPPLRIVMGNVSCDMDSTIGSLVLAYYYTFKHQELFVPVINCNKN